jgi:hypothetical protein
VDQGIRQDSSASEGDSLGGVFGRRESQVAAHDREPEQEAAVDDGGALAPDDDAGAPARDEWDAYPLIVFVIVATVLLTVFVLGPSLGATFLPGLVHH